MADETLFERIGGEATLRPTIERFIDRLFDDDVIGHHFARANRQRTKDMEYEFAAAHMGAALEYSGRDMDASHRYHNIPDEHFTRRLEILVDVLTEDGVPNEVIEHFTEHTLALKRAVLDAYPSRLARKAERKRAEAARKVQREKAR